jgi:hypothetical protein
MSEDNKKYVRSLLGKMLYVVVDTFNKTVSRFHPDDKITMTSYLEMVIMIIKEKHNDEYRQIGERVFMQFLLNAICQLLNDLRWSNGLKKYVEELKASATDEKPFIPGSEEDELKPVPKTQAEFLEYVKAPWKYCPIWNERTVMMLERWLMALEEYVGTIVIKLMSERMI